MSDDDHVNGKSAVLKYWHVILVLALQISMLIYTYARNM